MQTTINVTGMTCGHCVAAVTKALEKINGVEKAEVDLEKEQAIVTGDADREAMLAAIKQEGYDASVK